MKRSILFLPFFVLLALVLAAPVMAATNGPHGSYAEDTNLCALCHSTHAAPSPNLIAFTLAGVDNNTFETCTYCHRAGGSSRYDVLDGAIRNADNVYSASGGGFDFNITTEGTVATYNKGPSTSIHNVREMSLTGAPGGDSTATFSKSCSNCHNPHGTPNPRQLLSTVNGIPSLTVSLSVANELLDETVTYNSGINNWCGACHSDFNVQTAGSGDVNTGVYTSKKRHRVGMDPSSYPGYNANHGLPLELNGLNPDTVSCLTCHFAHGTDKTATVAWNRSDGTQSTSSALLRKNQRGVCQACHRK